MEIKSNIRLSYEAYTVAVICAMSFEMSAVRYMFDEEHERLSDKDGDSNIYAFGRLSGHNTVVGCLPGTQGKGAAAIIATNVHRTFPSIRYWLLVGIEGGVPNHENDIRLGDVVVSMPNGQYGGVVQYDLGKETRGGFERKGFLASPPAILRSSVEKMRSDHMLMDNKVNEFVSVMIEQGGRLANYRRPSRQLDVLFKPVDANHPSQATCRNCNKGEVISRRPRKSTAPEIHYGLVASGDRVIKSAAKRGAISRGFGGILCFEMEAAGLMTHFPALVVRGISDYSDSHKGYVWQQYAAATAAAVTTELLSYLDPRKPCACKL
ncbi:nucleoside phosphorylase domain-containing protein [Dactylonectria macrodidyma]|uniref:Nucleoside phosphorylase domain-containing protein n=1 Tax=Dactylonectria macrodidyma TaxID=307937 RepID=A0A9P9EW83_9HYPO|nr:nucleoside phosphorylase domain-containing protein [Dactylonectria macrodidyma]